MLDHVETARYIERLAQQAFALDLRREEEVGEVGHQSGS
jgi:hypothetical protein